MPLKRSSIPFFQAYPCKAAIDHLGCQGQIAVYAGAGLTIDRSQLPWDKLVKVLLKEVGVTDQAIEALFSLYALDQVASIIFQRLQTTYPDNWKDRVGLILAQLLYSSGNWKSGEASPELARLAKTLSDAGGHLVVLTSNYDTFYEVYLRELVPNPTVGVLFQSSDPQLTNESQPADAEDSPTPDLIYLHGMIPSQELRGELGRTNDIILGERQYIEYAELEHQMLANMIQPRSLLVYGSSLIDRPLLRALAEPPADNKKRFALMPNAGLSLKEYNEVLRQVQDGVRNRLRQFSVEPLFPDFYGQAAQFLVEVQACMKYRDTLGSYNSDMCPYGYYNRLTSWWGLWWGQRKIDEAAAQYRDHEKLQELTKIVLKVLDVDWGKVKAELWVRWDPSTCRELRLWASSSGTWIDKDTMRRDPFEHDSRMLAIQAFCEGRPRLGPLLDSSRWIRYFAVPLFFPHPYGKIPVGAVTIATMAENENLTEALHEENTAGLNALAGILREYCEKLLVVDAGALLSASTS